MSRDVVRGMNINSGPRGERIISYHHTVDGLYVAPGSIKSPAWPVERCRPRCCRDAGLPNGSPCCEIVLPAHGEDHSHGETC